MSRLVKLNLALAASYFVGYVYAQEPEYGPPKGTLVIQGGGSDVDTGIFETFINKAGGLDAKIVVVPTAGGNKNPDGSIKAYKEDEVLANWKKRGCTNVHMLHTHDPKVADTEEFAQCFAGCERRLVQWRAAVEHCRFLRQYANAARIP